MPPTISYNLISKHRDKLMGLAIVWIFLYHSKIFFPDGVLFHPLRFLVSTGFGGVDMFFFLSGFGLMHHMLTKYSDWLSFYKRRLFSIYPAYFIAVSISLTIDYGLNGTLSLQEILLSLTTMGFWLDNSLLYWFIPTILSLYICYPLFYRYYLRYQLKLIVLISATTLLTSIALTTSGNDHFVRILARIPIFLIGSHVSYLTFKSDHCLAKRTLAYNIIAFLFSFGVLLILMFNHFNIKSYGLEYYLFTIGTLPLCLFTSMLLNRIPSRLFFLSYCGMLSLEIYLVHKQIVFRLGEILFNGYVHGRSPNTISEDYGHFLSYSLYFTITLCLASLLHYLSLFIQTRINQHTDKTTKHEHSPLKQSY